MKKKGFTLIELMGVIMILGVIALIAIPVVDRQLKESKKDLSQTQKENIKDAAKMWAAKNIYNLPESGASCYIKYSDLTSGGYLKEELKDPNTNVEFSDDTVSIKVEKDANYNKYNYYVEISTNGDTLTKDSSIDNCK